jgi:hypothetical protein
MALTNDRYRRRTLDGRRNGEIEQQSRDPLTSLDCSDTVRELLTTLIGIVSVFTLIVLLVTVNR